MAKFEIDLDIFHVARVIQISIIHFSLIAEEDIIFITQLFLSCTLQLNPPGRGLCSVKIDSI